MQPQRHIGLAKHDCPGGLEPWHLYRVLGRDIVPVLRHAPGRGQPGHVIGLLDCHRDAEQRSVLTASACLVGTMCGRPCTGEVRHADRVDHFVVTLDTGDRLVGQFHRGHVTSTQGGREYFGRLKTPFHESDAIDLPQRARNSDSRNGRTERVTFVGEIVHSFHCRRWPTAGRSADSKSTPPRPGHEMPRRATGRMSHLGPLTVDVPDLLISCPLDRGRYGVRGVSEDSTWGHGHLHHDASRTVRRDALTHASKASHDHHDSPARRTQLPVMPQCGRPSNDFTLDGGFWS
ncbi:hypothetical protein CLV71_105340 [Actinophytocola oryzae]|uniref:Uncharacterized protein n=1 Tax=Actinophytocola oryzae TaxID=502181 RepID=A0A4R7VS71_9PSEU|nr:hypothetical protein CLV71_105340 [Actinophytocola oryzae]